MPLKHLLFAALEGVICKCSAQEASSAVPEDSAYTEWAYSDSCRAFDRLWTTMDSVHSNRSGSLTVLYIGGSHVQGGWIEHEMRQLLADWAPHAEMSRGMHLPYRLAHTNTPAHYSTEMDGSWTADRCTRGKGHARCEAAPIATGILPYPRNSASTGNWLRQHSQAHGMGYIDLSNALGGPSVVAELIEDQRLQPDGMHFTAKGYSAIANALFTAWMDAYSQAQKAPSLNNATDAQSQQ